MAMDEEDDNAPRDFTNARVCAKRKRNGQKSKVLTDLSSITRQAEFDEEEHVYVVLRRKRVLIF
jgi:hypothetical protein